VTSAWRIYYTNGRAFGSADGTWADAPSEQVLLVVEQRGERVEFHMGADHYQLEDDGTIVLRDTRTLLALIGHRAMSPIKFGVYVSHTEMGRVVERARREWMTSGD
jgi:hypothetical protein